MTHKEHLLFVYVSTLYNGIGEQPLLYSHVYNGTGEQHVICSIFYFS